MKIDNYTYLLKKQENIKIGQEFNGFVIVDIKEDFDFLLIKLDNINYTI